MRRGAAVLVAGWAHGAGALGPLASELGGGFDASAVSAAALCGEGAEPWQALARRACGDTRVIVGWSMGGMIALEAALRRPGLARALVILGGTARFCADGGYECGPPAHELRAMRLALRSRPRQVLQRFFRAAAAPATLSPSELEEKVEDALALGSGRLVRSLGYLERTDLRGALVGLDLPVLVVHGEADRVVPAEAGRRLAGLLPRARFSAWAGAGHCIPLRDPPRAAQEIRAFLEEPP